MDKSLVKAYIAKRAAMELKDGDVVNLGIGLPTMLSNYLPEDVQIILQSENGIVNTGGKPTEENADPLHIIDAGGTPASVKAGGCFSIISLSGRSSINIIAGQPFPPHVSRPTFLDRLGISGFCFVYSIVTA